VINPTTNDEIKAANAEFLRKVWTDETFGARLDSDPRSVLAEIGGKFPDDIEIKVVRDTDAVKYLHIPAAPWEGEISDAELLGAQGGTAFICLSAVVVTYFTIVSAVGGTGTFD
jgi:hypothetical protein